MFKVNLKTIEQNQRRRSGVFIVYSEYILHLFSSVSIIDFEQVNMSWITQYPLMLQTLNKFLAMLMQINRN